MTKQRSFLKFFMCTITAGTAVTIILSECRSIYQAIDDKFHSEPEIQQEASYYINKHNSGRLNIDLTVSVVEGDMAMFYYSCRTKRGWDSEREVGAQRVVDGRARNSHLTICDTELLIQVIVYTNFRKRSQRQNGMFWVINMGDHKI